MSEATARLTLVMEPPGKHAARWNTTMQVGPIPTPEEIARYSELLTKIMNIDIPSYNTGRGRYQAPDTARVSEISKVSLPDLSFGKAPSPPVWSHLTLGNYKDLASNDKRRKAIEVWQKLEWLLMQRQRSRKEKTPCTNVPFWSTAATIKQVMEHRKEQNLEGACCANTPFPSRAPWC